MKNKVSLFEDLLRRLREKRVSVRSFEETFGALVSELAKSIFQNFELEVITFLKIFSQLLIVIWKLGPNRLIILKIYL